MHAREQEHNSTWHSKQYFYCWSRSTEAINTLDKVERLNFKQGIFFLCYVNPHFICIFENHKCNMTLTQLNVVLIWTNGMKFIQSLICIFQKQAQAYHRTCSLSWYRGYFLYREKKVIVLTGLSWINIQKSTRLKFDFLIIYKYCIVANLTLL